MIFWFEKYNACNAMESEGMDAGGGEASAESANQDSGAEASEGEASGSAESGESNQASFGEGVNDSSDPWGNFDIDSYLAYDPMKDKDEPEADPEPQTPAAEKKEEAPAEPEPTFAPETKAKAEDGTDAPDPRDLELAVLRQQLQELVQGQQQNQGQQALNTSQDSGQGDEDSELAKLYEVPQSYTQMQIPENLLGQIMSGEPDQVRGGLNQFAQGLAQIVHAQVAQQAKAREEMLAKRVEDKATAPYREQQQQAEAKSFHDEFYTRHSELDKAEWKPYIATKMKQYAAQFGIQKPNQQFLDWGAFQLKKELIASQQAPVTQNQQSAQPAQKPAPTYMAGQGGGRASAAESKGSQGDIFDTLFG